MSQKNTPKAKTPTPLANVETASFDELWQRFQKSGCEKESFALAVHLYDRFPDESQKLLPKIKSEDLGYDGHKDDQATTHEWAAALTAAKKIKNSIDKQVAAAKKMNKKDGAKPMEIKDVAESEVHAQAAIIYARAKEDEKACRAL
jgi:hypothetical protein